jgi:hypothetical protein
MSQDAGDVLNGHAVVGEYLADAVAPGVRRSGGLGQACCLRDGREYFVDLAPVKTCARVPVLRE